MQHLLELLHTDLVWSDLAKVGHLGEIVQVFGVFWVDLVLGIETYCFMLLGKFYLLKMAKKLQK